MEHDEFLKTILSQYANSAKLVAILEGANIRIDPKADIDEFFVREHDLDTCGTHGLDVWGIIVGAPRSVEVKADDYLGYLGSRLQPFNQAPFFNGRRASEIYRLENEAYRQLIYFKAMANIINTTLPEIDRALWRFFEIRGQRGDVYSQETGVMTMRVVFRFELTPVERAIFRTYGGLLRPAGVGIDFLEIPENTFGFLGSDLRPFNEGFYFTGGYSFMQ